MSRRRRAKCPLPLDGECQLAMLLIMPYINTDSTFLIFLSPQIVADEFGECGIVSQQLNVRAALRDTSIEHHHNEISVT